MAGFKDAEVNKWILSFKKKLKSKYNPERIILFGSRARKDNLLESDVDMVIVSRKFEGVSWPRRIGNVAELWRGLVVLEPLCYTPEEFKIKSKEIGIVSQAVKEGIEI